MNHSDKLSTLRGGEEIIIHRRDGEKIVEEKIFIREVTAQDVIDGEYTKLLLTDYTACVEWLLGKPEGWARSLMRESWKLLREKEAEINFDFARSELEAANRDGRLTKLSAALAPLVRDRMMGAYAALWQCIAQPPKNPYRLLFSGLFPGFIPFLRKKQSKTEGSTP